MQKRTDAHFQEMTKNDDSAPYAVQGDREINRRTPTLNTLSTDAILREIINATKKNFVKFYISAIYNQTLAALFWHTCAKNHEMCATKDQFYIFCHLSFIYFPMQHVELFNYESFTLKTVENLFSSSRR